MKRKLFKAVWGAILISCLGSSLALAQSAFYGTSGSVTKSNLGLYGGHAEDIAIASNGNIYVALNSPTGFFYSTNSAASWNGPPAGSDFGNVSAVELGEADDIAYFIGGIKLYKVDITAGTFTDLSSLTSLSNFGQSMVYYDGGSTPVLLVAYRDGTVYKSGDNGSTFTSVTIDSAVTTIAELCSSPTAGTFYALADAGGTMTVYGSTDFGNTWSPATGALSCSACENLKVNPSDATVLVATGLDEVRISTDTGTTWNDVTSAFCCTIKQDISFDGSRIFVGSKYTDDNGVTWTDYNSGVSSSETELLAFFTEDPTSASTLYMTSMRGFAKSTDSGANWLDKVTGIFGVKVNAIDQASDKNIVYLAATAGIAKSVDFTTGPTWTYPLMLSSSGDTGMAVLIVDPYNSTATTQTVVAGSAIKISISTDGGTSWSSATISSALAARDSITDFARGALAIYAAYKNVDDDTGGVLYSTDDGATWSDMSLTNNAPANTIATLANYSSLTGTVTFTNGSTTVTGSGTSFLSEASANDIIILDSDASKVHVEPIPWATVASVDSDTQVTLSSAYNGTGGVGTAYKVTGDTLIVGAGGESTATATARGIFTATFDGTSWTWAENSDVDVDAGLIWDIVAVYSSTAGTVYAASGETSLGGVFRSNDGGSTWENLVTVGTGLPTDGWFTCVTMDTQDHLNIFAATGRPADTAYIYNSTDGGTTWSSYYTALIDEVPATMLVDGLTVGFTTGVFGFEEAAEAGDEGDSGGDSGGGGCFIATAAFGSPLDPHVDTLRQFRDGFLLGSEFGKRFVHAYYAYSPPVADFIAHHGSLRALVRWSILPVVGVSWLWLHTGTAHTMVVILLTAGLIIATAGVFLRRKSFGLSPGVGGKT